jgi:hypothetical protein
MVGLLVLIRQQLLQAKSNGRTGCTFCTIRRPATWTERRNQRFTGIAAYRSVGLHRSKADKSSVALVPLIAFLTGSALRSLWTLRARRALRAGHTLNALCPLRPGCALNAGLPFRSGIAAASPEGKSQNENCEREGLHRIP